MSAPPARSKTLSLSLSLPFSSSTQPKGAAVATPPHASCALLCFVWGVGRRQSPACKLSVCLSLSLFSLSVHLLSFTRPDSASHQMGRPTVSCMLGFEAVAPKLREHTSQVVHFN